MNFHHLCPQISWESWAIRAAPRIPLTNSIASNSCQCQHGPELLRDHGRGGTRWIWCTRRQLRLLFGGLESAVRCDEFNSLTFKWLKWTLWGVQDDLIMISLNPPNLGLIFFFKAPKKPTQKPEPPGEWNLTPRKKRRFCSSPSFVKTCHVPRGTAHGFCPNSCWTPPLAYLSARAGTSIGREVWQIHWWTSSNKEREVDNKRFLKFDWEEGLRFTIVLFSDVQWFFVLKSIFFCRRNV